MLGLWESKYDDWKLMNRDDELAKRRRTGMGGKYGTVEYEYIVAKLGKCPCCDEDVVEDELYVVEMDKNNDDEVFYHFSCYNYEKKQEEEDRRNGR